VNTEWLRWYYLIYLLPAGVAVLLLLLSGLSAGGDSDGDAGDVGDTGDVSAGGGDISDAADVAADGQDGDGGDLDDSESPGGARALLAFLGIGRAPLTLVLGSLMIGWGLFGLGANEILRPILKAPGLFVGPSLGIACVGGLICAKVSAELAARVMPKDESYAITRDQLVGLAGRVAYPVSETMGRVHLRDRFKTLHVASARVAPGQPPIERGTEIIVASMDPNRRYVVVEPLGLTARRSQAD
jgi:hypothetical protein